MLRLFLAGALVAMPLTVTAAEGTVRPLVTVLGPSLTPPDGTLIAAGPVPTATILYTGDVIGYVDPCG